MCNFGIRVEKASADEITLNIYWELLQQPLLPPAIYQTHTMVATISWLSPIRRSTEPHGQACSPLGLS